MSTSAFAHCTKATATGGVNLEDKTIVHSGGSARRTAGIAILANGTVTWPRTFTNVQLNPLTDWIIPNTSASSSYEVRLTNLTWVTKDEGFIVSPSGGTYSLPGAPTPGGDSDGDQNTWYNLGTDRYWVFHDDDSGAADPAGTQEATFDIQIRKGSTILATAAMNWKVSSSGGGGGGGGGCFVTGTLMIMEDGSLKEVQDIVPGDVMAEGGKVYQQQIGDASEETWFDVDGVIVTGTHTICKDGVWMHVHDAGYPAADCDEQTYYVVSNYYHKMVTANGHVFTDYSEVEYQSSGWDDWVLLKLNGKADNETMRKAIESTQR